jgi:autotransporter-associated beta strand protein
VWDNPSSDGITYVEENNTGSTGIQQVIPLQIPPIWISIVKIVWGDVNNPTTVTMAAFKDGAALSEAVFDTFTSTNLQTVTTTYNVDPTTFTNISLGGGRFDCDELRIGTIFDDVVGLVPGAPGIYWAPTGQGGSGIWGSGTNNWAQIPNVVGVLPQSTTNTLIFAGTNGTVTVNGTVTTGAGLQFSANGYSLVPWIDTPQISLAGANAAANTITVATGTNTIGVQIGGTAGMTMAGLGTLVLINPGNTYSGGTVLTAGTLRIAAIGSLGSGNVTFGGGTLQYPPGSGASPIDVSAIINPVASGQAAKIDTDDYDVTFGTAISGAGGLTKQGSGSLTLAAANTYAEPTTVSGGTLIVSSASGVIATLNVPAGGTVNLGAGAVIGALNVTGGTVNLVGGGSQVGTLFVSSGTFTNPSNYALTLTNSANLVGIQLSLSGASSFTLNGVDLLNPTSSAHRVVTATGGELTFVVQGLDVAIGQGSPGVPSSAATAHFYGSGVWDLVNGVATDINNVYGKDNHAFHYIQVPSGDFDIKVNVTGATNALAGLMARDNLVSEWDSATGNYIGIWTGLGNSVQAAYATIQTAASHASPPWVNSVGIGQVTVTPWLEIKRTGNLITTYCSSDGSDGSYVQVQQVDYTASPWGPTMYLGLDLINTATGGGSGAYDNVNFMGTAGSANLSTTEFALSGGALLNLGPSVYVAAVSTNGVALDSGCWAGSAITGANHIDPTIFTSTATGIAVIPPLVPPAALTVTPPADITVTAPDPSGAVVTFAPTVSGGTLPILATNSSPASGSLFPVGTNAVTCTATDSTCPFGVTGYGYFNVIVLLPPPPPPVLDPSTGFIFVPGAYTSCTFSTVAGYKYRLVTSDDISAPMSAWLGVVTTIPASDGDGWVVADPGASPPTEPSMTLTDQNRQSLTQRFYRIEASAP